MITELTKIKQKTKTEINQKVRRLDEKMRTKTTKYYERLLEKLAGVNELLLFA